MTIYDIPDYPHSPRFCPNKNCTNHRPDIQNYQWFRRYGYHKSKCRGKIPRFQCKLCQKTFSTQTFSIHYWTHSTIDFEVLDARLQSCAGQRQLGREYRVTHNVIANRIHRLARNYMACFDECYAENPINEDCCFDGFESYIRSQYHPVHINILIGKISQMPYGCTLSLLRRKGQMTKTQKKIRSIIDQHWMQSIGDYSGKITSLFEDFRYHVPISFHGKPWNLYTDEAPTYPKAIRRVHRLKRAISDGRMIHHQISSKLPRTRQNPLFPSNYIDRELRKNQADHVRETVRQGREIHLSLSRTVIALGYHSFKKPYRIPNFADIRDHSTHSNHASMSNTENPGKCLKYLYSYRTIRSHLKMRMNWMRMLWNREYRNPPVIDFHTNELKKKWQPGTRRIPRHLLC
jgi:transposase-like protein